MKSARLWILLVLAVLLPIRGAVAAAMLCPVGSSGLQSELRVQGEPAGHHEAAHESGGDRDHGSDHADPGHHEDGHDHGALDKCNMCSAYCSLTPLVSDVRTLLDPVDLAAVKFPDLCAPAPSFVSGGQERPPRTI